MKVANPSSQDRTPCRAILLAVSPAAALYRASGLVLWHLSDIKGLPTNVRCWGGKADVMFNPGRLGLNGTPGCGGSTEATPVTVCRGAELYNRPWASTQRRRLRK